MIKTGAKDGKENGSRGIQQGAVGQPRSLRESRAGPKKAQYEREQEESPEDYSCTLACQQSAGGGVTYYAGSSTDPAQGSLSHGTSLEECWRFGGGDEQNSQPTPTLVPKAELLSQLRRQGGRDH